MLTIEIAISTLGEGIAKACAVPLPPRDGLTYLIIHQTPDGWNADVIDPIAARPDVRYLRFDERGLSRSRNRALEFAEGGILIPTDDDVRFFPEALEAIRAEFERRANLAILTAQMTDATGTVLQKDYSANPFRHTVRSSLRTTSPEFAMRPDRLRQVGLSWNEAFGLGSRYPLGEENLFLMRAVRMGLECRYLPVRLTANPYGSGFRMDAQSGFARGALFTEMFGLISPMMILAFAFRKRKRLSGSLLEFLKQAHRGMVSRWAERSETDGFLGVAGMWRTGRNGIRGP